MCLIDKGLLPTLPPRLHLHLHLHLSSLPKAMVSLATLALGPCTGVAPSQAERAVFPARPSHLPSPSSVHLQAASRGPKLHLLRHSLPPVRAVAVDSDQLGPSLPAEQEKPRKYHFVVANAKFMLDEEEHFKELLFERMRNYGERNKEQDFWLVVEPKFLDKFPSITKRLKRPAAALVSTNGTWITFMKLRLDRVLADDFEADSLEEALAYTPVDFQFGKPENWVAPYPKYEFGWWEPFLPPASSKVKA